MRRGLGGGVELLSNFLQTDRTGNVPLISSFLTAVKKETGWPLTAPSFQ
jgi:hypothetical protein